MGALATKWPTMLDVASRQDPNGTLAAIADIIRKQTPLLQSLPMKEGNKSDGHIHSAWAAYGSASWRQYNKGTEATKSTTTQYSDVTGILNSWAEVDADLAAASGDIAKFRADEEGAKMQGMSEELMSTFFYGNAATDPEEFTGIAPRYAAYGSDARTTHVFNAGGSGSDNTSIYLLGLGPETVFGLYGKGFVAGLQREELGKIRITDASGYPLMAYCAKYAWNIGLGIKDWRYVVRIANIDVSDLRTAGDQDDVSANIMKLMLLAKRLLPSLSNCRPEFYCHPDVAALLEVKMMDKGNVYLTQKDITAVDGFQQNGVLHFSGIPVQTSECILLTETALTS